MIVVAVVIIAGIIVAIMTDGNTCDRPAGA
jgi:hypothetical protein